MRRFFFASALLAVIVSCSATIDSYESGKLHVKIAETADSEGIEKMDIFVCLFHIILN